MDTVEVAYAVGSQGLESNIKSIAVCAGSGGSVIIGKAADVYLTGEMSHVSNSFPTPPNRYSPDLSTARSPRSHRVRASRHSV